MNDEEYESLDQIQSPRRYSGPQCFFIGASISVLPSSAWFLSGAWEIGFLVVAAGVLTAFGVGAMFNAGRA